MQRATPCSLRGRHGISVRDGAVASKAPSSGPLGHLLPAAGEGFRPQLSRPTSRISQRCDQLQTLAGLCVCTLFPAGEGGSKSRMRDACSALRPARCAVGTGFRMRWRCRQQGSLIRPVGPPSPDGRRIQTAVGSSNIPHIAALRSAPNVSRPLRLYPVPRGRRWLEERDEGRLQRATPCPLRGRHRFRYAMALSPARLPHSARWATFSRRREKDSDRRWAVQHRAYRSVAISCKRQPAFASESVSADGCRR